MSSRFHKSDGASLRSAIVGLLLTTGTALSVCQTPDQNELTSEVFCDTIPVAVNLNEDSVASLKINLLDSIGSDPSDRYVHLTEADFEMVAKELCVEVAAIKAVVEIEAGKNMQGF